MSPVDSANGVGHVTSDPSPVAGSPIPRCTNCLSRSGTDTRFPGALCRRCTLAFCGNFPRFERLRFGCIVRALVWAWDQLR